MKKKPSTKDLSDFLDVIGEIFDIEKSKPEFFKKTLPPSKIDSKNLSDECEHFVVCLDVDVDTCTCTFYTNFGVKCYDCAYTMDLYLGKNVDVYNYDIIGQVEWSKAGLERVKRIEYLRNSGQIKQSDYE